MSRTGKIARLSSELREQVNSRLAKGEQAKPLLKWLNALPEVQEVLRSEFKGGPISPQNLSEWRNGGFRDWQIRQDALQLAQNLDDEHSLGHKSLSGSFSEKLAHWLILRFAAAAQNLATSEADPQTEWLRLRELCSDVARLRRGDLYSEHLRLRRDWLALQQTNAEHRREDLFWQWTKRPDIAKKLFPDRKGGMSEESVRWIEQECLGMDDEHGIFQHIGNTLREKRLAREAEQNAEPPPTACAPQTSAPVHESDQPVSKPPCPALAPEPREDGLVAPKSGEGGLDLQPKPRCETPSTLAEDRTDPEAKEEPAAGQAQDAPPASGIEHPSRLQRSVTPPLHFLESNHESDSIKPDQT